MAITIERCRVTGGRDENDRKIEETWKVKIDEGDDVDDIDPVRIYNNEGGNFDDLPQMFEKYQFSNLLGVSGINVGEFDNALRQRIVTVTYNEIPPVQGHNGIPILQSSLNPLDWVPEVDVDGTLVPLYENHGTFLGFFEQTQQSLDPCEVPGYPLAANLNNVSNSFVTLTKDTREPLVNTAGNVIDGGLETSRVDHRIQISKFATIYDVNALECYENRLNELAIDLSIATRGFTFIAQPFEIWLQRVKGIIAKTEFQDPLTGDRIELIYWRIIYDMLYRKGGWYTDIANIGTRRGVDAGDPDGLGGTYSALDLKAGQTQSVVSRGPDGFTDEEPKFLALSGRDYMDPDDASYLRYRSHYVADLNDSALGLLGNGVGP